MLLKKQAGFLILGAILFLSGCDLGTSLAKLSKGRSGGGVARLTARNMGALLQALQNNEVCGFKSPQVRDNFTLEGDAGGLKQATWEVKDCTLDFGGEGKEVFTTCDGVKNVAYGKVRVSVKQVVRGQATGMPGEKAVAPDGPDDVWMYVEVHPTNFRVKASNDPYTLTWQTGTIKMETTPRLALDNLPGSPSRGLCAVPTADVKFERIRYRGAQAFVRAGWLAYKAPVGDSDFSIQVGRGKDGKENRIDGWINVWGTKVKIEDEGNKLDPSYTREKHEAMFKCQPQLADQPIQFICGGVREKLAGAVLGLSALTQGQMTELVDLDTHCGFSSPEVLTTIATAGELGYLDGEATTEIRKPCKLSFPEPYKIETDNHGVARYVQGEATVTGRRTVRGRLVMSQRAYQQGLFKYEEFLRETPSPTVQQIRLKKPEAVLPASMRPAEIELRFVANNLVVYDQCLPGYPCENFPRWRSKEGGIEPGPRLKIEKGVLNGIATPLLGKDTDPSHREYGLCTRKLPIATLEKLSLKDAFVVLEAQGSRFEMSVKDSFGYVLAGTHNGVGNAIQGDEGQNAYVELNGQRFVPAGFLDPDYNEALFYESFEKDDLEVPYSDDDCSGMQVLAENTARLLVQNIGGVVKYATKPSVLDDSFISVDSVVRPLMGGLDGNKVREDATQGKVTYYLNNARMEESSEESLIFSSAKLREQAGFLRVIRNKFIDSVLESTRDFDGLGNAMYKKGWAEYTGEMTMLGAGLIKKKATVREMTMPNASAVNFQSIFFHDFSAYEKRHDRNGNVSQEPLAKMLMEDGALSVLVKPILGELKNKPGTYSVETPIVTFENVNLFQPSDVTITTNEGVTIKLTIHSSDFEARNGYWQGDGNYIRGFIDIEGHRYRLDTKLIPDYPHPYDQEDFNRRYADNPLLKDNRAFSKNAGL